MKTEVVAYYKIMKMHFSQFIFKFNENSIRLNYSRLRIKLKRTIYWLIFASDAKVLTEINWYLKLKTISFYVKCGENGFFFPVC